MTRFEKPADFHFAYLPSAPGAPTLKRLALLAAFLACAAGLVILCLVTASNVAESVSDQADPPLMQFVAP